jgi:poly-gamma-glutamate synthesis protein (capsule biosynthesis protein)
MRKSAAKTRRRCLLGAAVSLAVVTIAACRTREPAAAPAVAIAPQFRLPDGPQPTALRVLVGGDLLPHRPRLFPAGKIAEALAPLKPLFAEADATIANYETATGSPRDLTEASKNIALAASPAWMGEVARAKVTAITTANNHACDLGPRGLESTMAAARQLGMVSLGVDQADPWRPRIVAEKGGHRVCAVAWSTFVNEPIAGCVATGKIAVANYRKKGMTQVERAVAGAREAGCDAVIAIFHGGEEYTNQIPLALAQATRAANAGADAVVIHHPHVPSPVEVVATTDGRRVPVFASVGNLVSNQGESWKLPLLPVRKDRKVISLNAWTRLGVLADLKWSWPIEAAPGTRPRLEWGYHLVWIENDHAIHRDDPMPRIAARVFDPVRDRGILERLSIDLDGPSSLFTDPCWMEATGKRCE